MKQILVTGGAGYIGSHICKALADQGYEPVTLDNLVTGHEWAVQWGPLEVADVGNEAFADAIFKKYNIEAVIHMAALSNVGQSVKDPFLYFENNAMQSADFIRIAKENGVKKIVFSSTASVYGAPPMDIPLREDDTLCPVNPYGASKLCTEKTLEKEQMNYVSLRYFNAAGAEPEHDLGEAHNPETHLIPNVIKAALEEETVSVFGDTYPTKDKTCVRDYVHVTDLAKAHVAALEYLLGDQKSDIFNLGSGHGYSILEVIRETEKMIGKDIRYRIGNRRDGDPAVLIANIEKTAKALNWKPEHNLQSIIQSAVDWHQSDFFKNNNM